MRLVGLCRQWPLPSSTDCVNTLPYPNHVPQLALYYGAHLPWAQRISSLFYLKKHWNKLRLEYGQSATHPTEGCGSRLTPDPCCVGSWSSPLQTNSQASASTPTLSAPPYHLEIPLGSQ